MKNKFCKFNMTRHYCSLGLDADVSVAHSFDMTRHNRVNGKRGRAANQFRIHDKSTLCRPASLPHTPASLVIPNHFVGDCRKERGEESTAMPWKPVWRYSSNWANGKD
jgi:hypothetical protein